MPTVSAPDAAADREVSRVSSLGTSENRRPILVAAMAAARLRRKPPGSPTLIATAAPTPTISVNTATASRPPTSRRAATASCAWHLVYIARVM